MKHAEQLKAWDELIREGRASKVRALCHKLNHKKIPRELLVEFAQIARRVSAPDLIVLWLSPIIHSKKTLDLAANEQERAIYALGLLRVGAFREARQILFEINPENDPQVYFYRASLCMNQWNYKKAIPQLKKYISHQRVSNYQRLVGSLNLCAALVATRNYRQATKQIEKLMVKLEKQNLTLLKGNLLEIRAQIYFDQDNFAQGLQVTGQAAALVQRADKQSLLFTEKWKILLELKSNADKSPALLALKNLSERAAELQSWETVRDCDFHRAVILKDHDLIRKVYWGSKFSSFKKRILKSFGEFDVGSTYLRRQGALSKSIDLVEMAPTRSLKKFFFVLTREFYQPLRLTEIFDKLYEDEAYNPISSPMKIHRLIARARNWIAEHNLPIVIRSFRNSYRLELQEGAQIILREKLVTNSRQVLPFTPTGEFFKSREWANERAISIRRAQQEIREFVKSGVLEAQVRGPSTRYRLRNVA